MHRRVRRPHSLQVPRPCRLGAPPPRLPNTPSLLGLGSPPAPVRAAWLGSPEWVPSMPPFHRGGCDPWAGPPRCPSLLTAILTSSSWGSSRSPLQETPRNSSIFPWRCHTPRPTVPFPGLPSAPPAWRCLSPASPSWVLHHSALRRAPLVPPPRARPPELPSRGPDPSVLPPRALGLPSVAVRTLRASAQGLPNIGSLAFRPRARVPRHPDSGRPPRLGFWGSPKVAILTSPSPRARAPGLSSLAVLMPARPDSAPPTHRQRRRLSPHSRLGSRLPASRRRQ